MRSDIKVWAFEQALGWYPREWRERNAQAMLGTLLDEAEELGRTRPGTALHLRIALGGVREHLRPLPDPNIAAIVSQSLGVLFSLWYIVISWSPGIAAPGSIGHLSNPLALLGLFFIVSLVSHMLGKQTLGQVTAFVTMIAALFMMLAGAPLGWLGAGPASASIPASLALIGALRPLRRLHLGLLVVTLCSMVVCVELLPFVVGRLPWETTRITHAVQATVAITTLLSVFSLATLARRRETA